MEDLSLSGQHKVTVCSNCGNIETVALVTAKSQGRLHIGALWLSAVACMSLIWAHIFFSYHDKVLPIPEIVWLLILAPWLGKSSSKIAEIFGKKVEGKTQ